MKSRSAILISIVFITLFCLKLGNTLLYARQAQLSSSKNTVVGENGAVVQFTAVSPQSPAPSWYNQIVGQGTAGVSTSIAADSSGYPHISYTSWEGLSYAFWTGSTWISQTVDNVDSGPGYYNSIAIDSVGRPHIAYLGSTGSNQAAVKYAHWTGSSWHIEVIDSVTHASGVSLAIDDLDQPHVSYFEAGYWGGGNVDIGLKYAHRTGNGWDIQLVDGVGFWYMSLALDSAGNPHIAYLDQVNSDLKYAHKEGGAWDIQIIDFEGEVGGYNSIAVDSAGHPQISYQDMTSRFLKFAYWDGTGWATETVESGGWNSSMALDALGKSHIIHNAYYQDSPLKHTYRDGDEWQTEIIAEMTLGNGETSVASSDDGYLHVSYYSAFPEIDIWYARTLPLLNLDKNVSSINNVQVGDTLTYTLTLTGSGVTVELYDSLPDHVNYMTGTLTYPAIYSPTIHAVMWQGILSDTAQVFQYQVMPTTGQAGDPTLSIPIVNTAWLTDTEYARAAYDLVIVNGWRSYLPLVTNQ